jgi:uncharacterized protein
MSVNTLGPDDLPSGPEAAGASATIQVEVLTSDGQRHTRTHTLHLLRGATVGDALQAAGVTVLPNHTVAVWGKHRPLDWPLDADDRVAVLRPLTVNPMEARRRRQDHQRRARLKLGLKAGVKPALADPMASDAPDTPHADASMATAPAPKDPP